MRITKTSNRASVLNNAAMVANAGCNQCPCCGETKKTTEYISIGDCNKGILTGLQKTWAKGFFNIKSMRCDCYHCLTCGAQWESEPYEW